MTLFLDAELPPNDTTRLPVPDPVLVIISPIPDPLTVIRHTVPQVRAWAAQRITDPAALLQLAMDDEEVVRAAVLANPKITDNARVAAALHK